MRALVLTAASLWLYLSIYQDGFPSPAFNQEVWWLCHPSIPRINIYQVYMLFPLHIGLWLTLTVVHPIEFYIWD